MSDETERADPRYRTLEALSGTDLLLALLEGQDGALRAVREAVPPIERAAEAVAGRLADPAARLAYCGAGTSGRLALLDGVELGPTFSWPAERTVFLLAGGAGAMGRAREGAEDDEAAARRDLREAGGLGPRDVLVALAASGRTPYTLRVVAEARAAGALTLAFANNPDTPLLRAAEHPILLRTGAEVLAGSTRLSAGTAQKIALNLLSTAVMVRLGKVFRGRMVDMRPTNRKLRDRARGIVAEVAGCTGPQADEALREAGGSIREAILLVEGGALSRAPSSAEEGASSDAADTGVGAGA